MSKVVLKTVQRTPKHAPNKTEARYLDHLALLHRAGQIKGFGFQRYTFRLADDTRYTPDAYVVTLEDVLEFHEVKGFMRDDAHVKLKMAAEMFCHPFYLVTWDKGWTVVRV